MTLSDSLPIQFWPTGTNTFNEDVICGLAKQDCFCQPYQTDDTIVIQVTDTILSPLNISLVVVIVKSDNTIFDIVDMTNTPLYGIYSTSIATDSSYNDLQMAMFICDGPDGWHNFNTNLYSWTGTTGVASTNLFRNSSTKVWRHICYGNVGDTINITYSITMTKAAGAYNVDWFILLYDSNGNIVDTVLDVNRGANGTDSGTIAFVSSHAFAFIGYFASEDGTAGAGGIALSVTDFTVTELTQIGGTFIGEDNPSVYAKSDCIDFRASQDCTELISYTNSSDFDGINYGVDVSPDLTFYLRIPAIFFEEKNPQEQEDMELSNGQIVTIRQTIQEKRLLDTGFMPNYMHRKLQKVLMHETVTIDGDTWKKRDSYDDSPIKKYNLKRASVWLTKYDSVEKNTI